MNDTVIDKEIFLTKQRLRNLYECKKAKRKLKRMREESYHPPVFMIVSDWIDTICYTIERLIK